MQTYPNAPGYKERGGTSQLAAEILDKNGRAAMLRVQTLQVLLRNPLGRTGNEIARALKERVTSIRPRVCELKKTGLIEKVGTRRNDGSMMAIWRITSDGKLGLNYMEANTCSM